MKKRYFYYVVFAFGKGGQAAAEFQLDYPLQSWAATQNLKKKIEADSRFREVLITNFILLRTEDEQ